MNKIFAVLCIIGCTFAEEKATTPDAAASRRLKTRQVGSVFTGLDHFIEPVHPVFVQDPQVVASQLHYVEPSVVSYGAVQPAAHFVHPVNHFGIHAPATQQVYSYVPSVGYGQLSAFRAPSAGFQATSSVSSSSPSGLRFGTGSQQASVQAAIGQTGAEQDSRQSGFAQGSQQQSGAQQSAFSQGVQQSALRQDAQQTALRQDAQQNTFAQGSQQFVSQSGLQTENVQSLVAQPAQQTESQQSGSSQYAQGSEGQQSSSQQSGQFQYGFLRGGFGQQQQAGIVQAPVAQNVQSQAVQGQSQGASNDQSESQQNSFASAQQSGSGSSQQSAGSFSPSSVLPSVAGTRQSSSQVVSQSGQGVSPAGTVSFNSPVFGYSPAGASAVRLIQPYNLSPSYAIHGFRAFPSVSSGSASQVNEAASSGAAQSYSGSSSQQFAPVASDFQFDASSGQAASQSDSQTSFRSGSGNGDSQGVQYSYSTGQSSAQPATVRSGSQASGSSSSSSDGQASGGLASFHSSLFQSGAAAQDSASGLVQGSSQAQQSPAILRMANDYNLDGSFSYGFESENGISSSASGAVRSLDPEHSAQVISGSYSYTAPDGTPISTNYYADETGFHAQGVHLPTPPPVPEYIARALQVLPQQDQVQPTVESN